MVREIGSKIIKEGDGNIKCLVLDWILNVQMMRLLHLLEISVYLNITQRSSKISSTAAKHNI